jgi:hypothetical protein
MQTGDFFSGMNHAYRNGQTLGLHSYMYGDYIPQTEWGVYGGYAGAMASFLMMPGKVAVTKGLQYGTKGAQAAWRVFNAERAASKVALSQRSLSVKGAVKGQDFLTKYINHINKTPIGGSKTISNSMRFPANPNQLLSNLPRDAKGHIYTSDILRIRPEKHALKAGEIFSPRHHGQHYHVEGKINRAGGWGKENVYKVKPNNYEYGDGTGFIPGEPFPGL